MVPLTPSLLPRYNFVRATSRRIHDLLRPFTTREDYYQSARALGLLQGETITLDTEDDLSLIADLAYHSLAPDGSSLLARQAPQLRGQLSAREQPVLEAMARARFAVWKIEAPVPGVGAYTRDLLRGGRHAIVDRGLSMNAPPGPAHPEPPGGH